MIRWGWKQPPFLGIAFTNDYDSLIEGIRNSPCCLPSINNHNLSQIVMHEKNVLFLSQRRLGGLIFGIDDAKKLQNHNELRN
jgi:hypothetical protein